MSTLSFAVSKETEEALAQEVTQVSNIDPKQAYALLKKTYPHSIGQNLPLMIGVHKQVMAEMPAIKQATLRAAFRLHVRNPSPKEHAQGQPIAQPGWQTREHLKTSDSAMPHAEASR